MKKTQRLLWLRLVSAVIDLPVIYCVAMLLKAIIWKFVFADFAIIFIATYMLYYFSSYLLLKGQTAAKLLTGIIVLNKNGAPLSLTQILLREIILKGALGLIMPVLLLPPFFPVWSTSFTILLYTVILLVSFILFLFLKNPWWELFSKTTTIRINHFSKTSLRYTFIVTTILIFAYLYNTTTPFLNGGESIKTSLLSKYPAGRETERYADFIRNHTKDPVDYIFDLFKTHDIVVISERMHPEYTQYEMIFKIIKDERFIKNVGNIFTECGSVSFQDTLNTYLQTKYNSEDELNRGTANLQRNSNAVWPLWSNTNLFDLFKTVHQLNNKLPDSSKLNWYFTDLPVHWETMTHEKFQAAYSSPVRDSMMAVHVIEQYKNLISKQSRKKALVIMNTRHGYGLIRDNAGKKTKAGNDNATAYIMEAIPGKIANVMINTVSMKYGVLLTPVQDGKWETAFSSLGNPETGFDFAGSPFGDDSFDAAFFNIPGTTYKDVFTGYIFYKPLSQHFEKDGFPYEFDGFEDTLLRRAGCVSIQHAEGLRRSIEERKQNPTENFSTRLINYGLLYNMVNVIMVPVMILITYLIGLFFFIKRWKTIKRSNYLAAD